MSDWVRRLVRGVQRLARPHPRIAAALIGTLAVTVGVAAIRVALGAKHLYDDSVRVAAQLVLNTGPQSTIVFDGAGEPLFSFHTEQRIDVPLERMSPYIIAAVLAAEDQRFLEHPGFDLVRIGGAFVANLRARRIVEGASTITQQLVRSLTGDRTRSYDRKVREIFMAVHLERRFTKRAILQTYLNRIYFGASYYGVEAAARGYFGKPALELGPHEAAALAAAIKAPAYYSPIHQTTLARARRQAVLAAMADAAVLSQEAYAVARRTPVEIAGPPRMHDETDTAHAPGDTTLCGLYFKAAVRRQLVQQFGWHRVYQGGLRVYTTVDPAMQHAAEGALDRRLAELTSTRRADDASRPLQGALVAIDPPTGHVRALVGGRDFHRSPFDRATQARRQPGSAFKPLLYAAAIELGYTPGMRLSGLGDAVEAGEGAYRPADRDDASSFTLRRALTISSNRAAVHLLQDIGPRTLIRYARRFGISTRLPAVPSLALGTGEVTLFELTAAFGALANEGVLSAPVLIRRVEDASGLVLYKDPQIRRRAVKRTTAYLVTSMLADVVNRGSGYRVRSHGFTLAAAGKTGTTDDYGDAWFLGYTPQLAAGVWFGFDAPDTIMSGGYGGVVAAPAWADFMTKATAGHEPKRFARPPEIVDVPVCPVSGQRAVSACYLAAAVAHGTPTTVGEGDGESAGPAPTTIAIDLAVEGSRAAEPCAFHSPRVAPAGGIRAGPPTHASRPGLVGTLLP